MAHTALYPRARTPRPGGGTAAPGQIIPPPRPRVFNFVLRLTAGGNVRSTRSSPVLVGPFLIQSVQGFFSAVDNDSDWGLELGTSAGDVSETDIAMTTAKPWETLIESFGQNNASGHTPQPVFPFGTTGSAGAAGFFWPMRLWVNRSAVRLVCSMQAQAALGNPVGTFLVNVLDQVSAEALSVTY